MTFPNKVKKLIELKQAPDEAIDLQSNIADGAPIAKAVSDLLEYGDVPAKRTTCYSQGTIICAEGSGRPEPDGNLNLMGRNRYCTACGEKKACGHHHVYAIELKSEVLKNDRFREAAGVDEAFEGRCFYVGQTRHQVTCRYKQHKARRRGGRSGFVCRCREGREAFIEFTPFNRGNAFVRQYAYPMGIRGQYVRDFNPVRGGEEAAKAAEKSLALSLRSLGFAVHYA